MQSGSLWFFRSNACDSRGDAVDMEKLTGNNYLTLVNVCFSSKNMKFT